MDDSAKFQVQSRVPPRPGPLVLVAISLFVVAILASIPVVTGIGRDLPLVSRLLPGRESGPVQISGAFLYQQQRSLSCEYASLHIATSMLGKPVSEYDFEAVVPLAENPHEGYRGDIRGSWGNTIDYGVYASPLVQALEEFGFTGDAFYGDRADLALRLDRGNPTIVWLAMRGAVESFDTWDANGSRFQLTRWMHVMVAYGYDDDGVYLTDPGTAVYRYYEWEQFLAMWGVMDGMALSVSR